ncbi:MAG TPA: nuclear transport factor 2 family protein [Chitinophagaceae bacterium]|nr:nuclear transport factor 2 family protein [Chitinophagaceae bacterium]
MTTKETVKAMYDAFATGNIPFILETVSENFTWQDPCNPALVPFGGLHKGKAGFMEFFQQLGSSTDTMLWQVDNYVSEGDTVVAEGKHGFQAKTTGKSVISDWSMVWRFENGVPVEGRSYYNTADSEKAFSNN